MVLGVSVNYKANDDIQNNDEKRSADIEQAKSIASAVFRNIRRNCAEFHEIMCFIRSEFITKLTNLRVKGLLFIDSLIYILKGIEDKF